MNGDSLNNLKEERDYCKVLQYRKVGTLDKVVPFDRCMYRWLVLGASPAWFLGGAGFNVLQTLQRVGGSDLTLLIYSLRSAVLFYISFQKYLLFGLNCKKIHHKMLDRLVLYFFDE